MIYVIFKTAIRMELVKLIDICQYEFISKIEMMEIKKFKEVNILKI